MKTHVVDIGDLERMSPVFRGKQGNLLAGRIIKMFALDRVNALYQRCCEYKGAAFASALLQDLGVQYRIGNSERLEQLPEGAFITISNHPYGGLDGIMLIDLMAHIRQDFKLMVNKLLSLIEAMEVNFISVRPQGNKKLVPTANLNGIRETLGHLQEGHPMGFFPSGQCLISVSAACVCRIAPGRTVWSSSFKKPKSPYCLSVSLTATLLSFIFWAPSTGGSA